MLFLWDQTRESPEKVMAGYWSGLMTAEFPAHRAVADEFANELLCGTIRRAGEVDPIITTHAEHWRLERMSAVDRNILRLGVYELLEKQTPAPVVINEALELGRRFSGEPSVQFLNGVLDAVRKALEPAITKSPNHQIA